MARSKGRSTERQARKLQERPVPFLSLLLAVPVSYLGFLVLHLFVRSDRVERALATGAVVAAACLLATLAYLIASSRRRDPVVCWHLVGSVLAAGAGGAVTVAIGYPREWVVTYLVGGVVLACSWMFYRLDALRADTEDGAGNDEGDLRRELGLDKVKFGKPELHYGKDGKLARVELDTTHVRGGTVEDLQGNTLAALESVANAVRGRGAAVAGENASKGHVTLILQDVLKNMIPYPGPSSPGGCITDPIVNGMYEDHQPAKWYLAGNRPEAPNPSNRGIMGMTRTGKTQYAQVDALEMFTRRNVVIFWFDSVKGAQTIGPIRDGLDIVVADEGAEMGGDPLLYKAGIKALKRLIRWRAGQLGRYGFRFWTPECAVHPQLRMPFLYVHIEEADELFNWSAEDMIFLASKMLSAGMAKGASLQRADAVSMPTQYRFNVGTWHCFGCGDEYSAGFALSDAVIKAGAHPENWKQSKPGYCYHEGIGVDPSRYPRVIKGNYASDEYMAAHTAEWAPLMMPLDRGSIDVLGDWYQEMKRIMDSVDPNEMVPAVPLPGPNGNGRRPVIVINEEVGEEERGRREFMAEAAAEIAEMKANGELERDEEDPEMDLLDPTRPLPPPTAADDEVTWENPPPAPSKEVAEQAFDRALFELAADESLRDPRTGETVFQVNTLVERYGFRSRPWFSERLSGVVEGEIQVYDPETGEPAELTLTRGAKSGQYRLKMERQPERQAIDVSL